MFGYLIIGFFLFLIYHAISGLIHGGTVKAAKVENRVFQDSLGDVNRFNRVGGPQMYDMGQLIDYDK